MTGPRLAPLTSHQKREIVRLCRLGEEQKVIARKLGCSHHQVGYAWRCSVDPTVLPRHLAAKRRKRALNLVAFRAQQTKLAMASQYQAARDALRLEIEAAKAERATAPLFRIRAGEWA